MSEGIFLEVAPTPSLPPGGEGGAPATDEGETGERTHVTHPTNTNHQATIPRPCPPPCHLRANDFVIAAPLTKNHALPPTIAAQSNPAPSGAPAGGISIAERYYITLRTAEKSLPPGGEGGTPVPDEGETGERSHVPHPANTNH